MADRLTQRDLNRALLARQSLLERGTASLFDTIEQVAGLQSQAPIPPFAGLWSRVADFDETELQGLIDDRQIVRATMMRHTIHFVTARDYAWLRPTIQPALEKSFRSVTGSRLAGFDVGPYLELAEREFKKGPTTFARIQQLIKAHTPESDERAVAYAVRTYLYLVGVPNDSRWRFGGRAPFMLAGSWLRRKARPADPKEMVRRYLRGFGPATPGDAKAWSGVPGMRAVFDELGSELRTFKDEAGRTLYDVEDGLLPGGDAEAPVRFLPEFDNTLLGHKDRTRVIADEYRPRVTITAGRMLGTLLLDGFAAGNWRVEGAHGAATMTVHPWRKLDAAERKAIEPEAIALMAYLEPGATTHRLAFA